MKKVIKNGWKRVCAVILAAAMTLTMLPVDVQAEDEKKEFYRNGFEDGEYQGIMGRGAEIEVSTSVHHDVGNNSLAVSKRSATWHGIQLPLAKYVISGNTYDFKVYVKQDTGSAETIDMGIQYKDASDSTQYPSLAGSSCTSGEWTELSGSFTVPETANEIALFLQCSTSETADFYVDDLSISGIPQEINEFKPDAGTYDKMVKQGVFSTGNNARIKAVLQKAREGKDVSLAYIGGSITEGGGYKPNSACYAEVSATAFANKYGKDGGGNVHFINAGMSGTSSDIGIIRYGRDVVGRLPEGSSHPDILFVEFAVNDSGCETKGGAYEGLIRQALKSGSAVVLVFSVFNNLNRVEEMNYRKYGTKYDLPMISTADAIKDDYQTPGFYDWFYNDSLHPNANGYKLMADCILELMDRVDKEDTEPDNITDVDSIEAVTSSSYEEIKMIDSTTTADSDPAISAISAGGFSSKDSNVPTFQYQYNGKDGEQWFPNNWMYHGNGTNAPLTIEVNCRTFMLLYKETSESAYGSADLYVDGVKKSTLSCYNKSGWNNGKVCIALQEEESAKHKIELKMAAGDEAKKFTLYAIGYQTDYVAVDQAVENVVTLINAIGEVLYNDDCKQKIDAAREAYDKLTDTQKELVDNYQTLTDAETKYNGYQTDDTEAKKVAELINAIGEVSYNDDCKQKIDAAREAYDKLTDAQKELVDNYQTLTDAETKYNGYQTDDTEAKKVAELINAIGEVSYNDDCKQKIDAAREAYDKLTDAQKELVDNYQTLTDAEAKYKSLVPSEKNSITEAVVNKIKDQYYTGKAKKPSLTITYKGSNLKVNEDYTVNYKNNTKIGTATVKIKGKGNYTGEVSKTFKITVKKNAVYTVGSYKYKITNAKTNGKGTVALSGVKSKKGKSIKVADTVEIGGKKFLVTSIDNNAYLGCSQATSATIGKNVTKIGSKAFYNCKKLKKITIKSTKLKSVGAKAFKGINKKATIKVPKSKLKAYQRLLKGKGQVASVKIKK